MLPLLITPQLNTHLFSSHKVKRCCLSGKCWNNLSGNNNNLLFKMANFFRSIFSNVISLIIHPYNTPINWEQRTLQTLRNGTIEIFTIIFRHLENNFCSVFYIVILQKKWNNLKNAPKELTKQTNTYTHIHYIIMPHKVIYYQSYCQWHSNACSWHFTVYFLFLKVAFEW